MKYKSVYNQWRNDPEKYWQNLANDISWKVFPKTILNKKNEYLYEWFPDGILNTCYNAVDKNIVEGRGNQVAIYYESPITNSTKKKSSLSFNCVMGKGLALRKNNCVRSEKPNRQTHEEHSRQTQTNLKGNDNAVG